MENSGSIKVLKLYSTESRLNTRSMKYLINFCLITTLLVLLTTDQVNSKRVLVITPSPSFSHQVVFRGLCSALHKRGHHVVFVTPNPLNHSTPTNFTEIDLTISYKTLQRLRLKELIPNFMALSKLEVDRLVQFLTNEISLAIFKHPEIQKIYAGESNEKFDAIIAEAVSGESLYALAHKLNAPFIGIISLTPHMYHHYTVGNPMLPSHPSNWEFLHNTGYKLPFWKRVQNFIQMWRVVYNWKINFLPKQEKLAKTFLGNDVPPLDELAQNMSLLLVNHHPALDEARPWQPNVIFFNGFHINENPPPLPKDMSEFLGNATNGFIYMNLGSNMKSTQLPPSTLNDICKVFSRLPYKVLWKFEADELPGKHDNIFISKWIPQQGVLAHPNIKLFIYQGGYQSTEETVHCGVPVIAMPVMFDQIAVARKLESLGVARTLNFAQINEEIFEETVLDVLNNKRYKTKMMELCRLTKDNPYDTKEHAIWWIEYVMRHKGAPHLRYSGVDDPWYQRYEMDVIAFLSIILFCMAVVCAIVLVQTVRWSYKQCCTSPFIARILLSQQTRKKNE